MYDWATMLHSRNELNTVNHLSPNKNKPNKNKNILPRSVHHGSAETNLTSTREDADPWPALWVKDPALL